MDMVDNSAGLLERAPVRASLAAARVSWTPIWRGHALILVATLLLVGQCPSFAFACPAGGPRPRNCGIPSSHAKFELSTVSMGTTPRPRGYCATRATRESLPRRGRVHRRRHTRASDQEGDASTAAQQIALDG